MKFVFVLLVLLLMTGCSPSDSNPEPGTNTWDNAKWDSNTWEE